VARGSIADAVECAAEAIGDEGFRITSRNDTAGLLNAVHESTMDDAGEGWIEVKIVPGQRDFYRVEVHAGESDAAQEAAGEIVTECGTGM
jgi:hypothetical protein